MQEKYDETQANLERALQNAKNQGEGNPSATFTDADMAALRLKTRAVEEIDMKIDESIRVC